MMGLLLFIAVLVFIALFFVGVFNGLVTFRNHFKNAFAQIDVQLQRRYELIPNLVETAKAYLTHEQDTLTAVISARNSAVSAAKSASGNADNAQKVQQLGMAESLLGASLGRLMAVAENYPELKANETISQLMEELASTENRVGFARQAFNDAVTSYNTYKQSFPPVVLAKSFGHIDDASLLVFADSAEIQAAPKVQF